MLGSSGNCTNTESSINGCQCSGKKIAWRILFALPASCPAKELPVLSPDRAVPDRKLLPSFLNAPGNLIVQFAVVISPLVAVVRLANV